MAIRITGMYSGLDTESIITQLASAQSVKKNKLVKEQTKLSWKQDAWKALNTKVYNFYTNVLDNMRYQSSYMKKSTKVSNSNAVSVVTGNNAPNSVQALKIGQLAKEAYLTGGRISEEGGKAYTKSTKLSELGFTQEGSFAVKVNGKTTNITLKGDMKISDVVKQFESAGLNASFDEQNQRFYLSAKSSGSAADFTITSNDANGKDILSLLGFGSAYKKDSTEYKEYALWASYADPANADKLTDAKAAEALKRAESKKASTESLKKKNEELAKKLESLRKTNDERTDPYDEDETAVQLYDKLYGPEIEVQKKDDEGNLVFDDDNNPVMVKERSGGLKKDLDDAKAALKEAQKELAELRKNGATEQEIADAETKVTTNSNAVSVAQKSFDDVNGKYKYMKSIEDTQASIDKNDTTIQDNDRYYTVDSDGKVVAEQPMIDEVDTYFASKIVAAQQYMADAAAYDAKPEEEKKALASKLATKVDGQDARISLNGVEYSSSKNTFEINGLTITAQQETDEEITLTTTEDADGVYDMIKNFITEYNKLINEMSSLYNAEAAKGYEPLLSEEKAELADSEIEEWEKKIKDSLLRRDATLGDVSDAMRTVMLQGAEVNGKKMYLSDFGINTLGYFNAADNEKGAYHIDGDKDDATVSKNTDTLRQMIASDPETVMDFFSGLSKNLYDKLTDKMKSVKDTSSAFTVYNDKLMKKEYDNYKSLISKEEQKLNDLMDKWYNKFSVMETTLAKLQSKNNAVAGMFGGN